MWHQLVQHGAEATDQYRNVSLAIQKMRHSAGNLRRQPLCVMKGSHQVSATVPDVRRHGELARVKAPVPSERQVVVDPAVDLDYAALEATNDVESGLTPDDATVDFR